MQVTVYESSVDIQIIPDGEEEFHSFDFDCDCKPHLYSNKQLKCICLHKSWSDEDMLEMAEYSAYHTTRQIIDC